MGSKEQTTWGGEGGRFLRTPPRPGSSLGRGQAHPCNYCYLTWFSSTSLWSRWALGVCLLFVNERVLTHKDRMLSALVRALASGTCHMPCAAPYVLYMFCSDAHPWVASLWCCLATRKAAQREQSGLVRIVALPPGVVQGQSYFEYPLSHPPHSHWLVPWSGSQDPLPLCYASHTGLLQDTGHML